MTFQGKRIVIDERERKSGIPELLSKAGLATETRMLPVADYIVGPGTAVERKTVRDMVSSVFDGRLPEQCDALRANYERPVLLVEGDLDGLGRIVDNPFVFYGALCSVVLGFGIPVVPTPSASHTAVLLAAMCASRAPGSGPFLKRIKKPSGLREQQLALLAALPGVGPKLAERMLEKFGTPSGVFSAPASDLAKVPGLGRARAEKVRKVAGPRVRRRQKGQDTLDG